MPTGTSMILLTPFARQDSTSLGLMRRDALVMSGKFWPTPLQNNFMPAPVPVDSTIGEGEGRIGLGEALRHALVNG
jgi:hypothetical protein